MPKVLKVQKVFSGSGSSKELKKIELDSEEGPSCSLYYQFFVGSTRGIRQKIQGTGFKRKR